MGIITTIELTKRRAVIYVDGVAFLRVKRCDYDELPLTEGESLDEEEYMNRLCARQSKRAYEAALDMLSDRDMTASGLVTGLVRKGFLRPVAESVCGRLAENRLIDDKRFAERYVELRQDGQVGRYALKRKLRAKGIDEDTANEALGQLDDAAQLEAATGLARRLARRYVSLESYAARGKLSQALARRGYSWDIVREAIEKAGLGGDDDFVDAP